MKLLVLVFIMAYRSALDTQVPRDTLMEEVDD